MFRQLLRSLSHTDFRIFFLGQAVSLTGTWMQNVAQAWLVYSLTGSSVLLGLVAFMSLFPVLLFGLLGGVLVDRLPRRQTLMAAQVAAMAQAFGLGALALSGHIEIWHIVALAFLLGLVHAVEMPARHSFIAELVPRTDLPNAIALNSGVFNMARFVGPAIAGWLVSITAEGVVFFINGCSFLLLLAGLIRIGASRPAAPPLARGKATLREGLRFAWEHPRIRAALLLIASVSAAGTAYAVLMPVFAREVFQGDARSLGMLIGASGLGAIFAAMLLAWLAGRQTLEHHIGIGAMVAGAAMAVFSRLEIFTLGLPALVVLGFALTTTIASTNTLIQMLAPDQMRGRIMALFSVVFIGLTSIGNLLAGGLAALLGAPDAVLLFGAVCLGAGAVYRRHRSTLEGEETR